MKKADFYLARYIGLAARYPESKKTRKDLEELLRKRQLNPKAFLPGDFDPDFLEWFEKGLDARWGTEETRTKEKFLSIETENMVSDAQYFATVTMVPELQSWFVMKEGSSPRAMMLVLGSARDNPLIFCGRLFQSAPAIYFHPLELPTQKHAVHFFWTPEFYDLDKDGTPELWLRYNLAWDNGFVQVLGIYKLGEQNQWVLLKEFRGENEGIARHLGGDKVELAIGFGSRNEILRMNFDRHHLQVWEFKKGEFHKIFEKKVPHILKNSGWKKYFIGEKKTRSN